MLGLADMVVASFLFATMGAMMFQVRVWDPEASSITASFIRSVVNLFLVFTMALSHRSLKQGVRLLFGDFSWSLWARGFFGTISLMGLIGAIHLIGLGEASFLHSFNVVWIAALSPLILGQKNSSLVWMAVLLGLLGLYFLYQPDLTGHDFLGRTVGLISGVSASIAYMMIAKAGQKSHAYTVIFYLCFLSTIIHLLWFAWFGFRSPYDERSWLMLLGAGFVGSMAQIFLTRAYQKVPAALASAVSYCTPLFGLGFGVILFHKIPNERALLGAAIILVSGVALPFIQSSRAATRRQQANYE